MYLNNDSLIHISKKYLKFRDYRKCYLLLLIYFYIIENDSTFQNSAKLKVNLISFGFFFNNNEI